MRGPYRVGHLRQLPERFASIRVERRHGHDAAEGKTCLGGYGVGNGHDLRPERAAPVWVAVQADLDQAGDPAPRLPGPRAERADQPQPVDRVDNAGIRDHARNLVGLQLADEVPCHRNAEGRTLGSLRRGFLVPVIRYPAVKRNEAVLRLMLYGRHTDAQVDGFVQTLAEVKSEYGF